MMKYLILILGGIVGFYIYYIYKKKTTKVCQYCGETIKKKAILCRYCGSDLVSKKEEIERRSSNIVADGIMAIVSLFLI